MTPDSNSPKPPGVVVFWIIWFAILQGLVIIQFFVGGGIPKGADQGTAPALFVGIAGALAVAALSIRIFLIPRLDVVSKKLPAMIVGLALSEAVGLVGIFLIEKNFPRPVSSSSVWRSLVLLVSSRFMRRMAPASRGIENYPQGGMDSALR